MVWILCWVKFIESFIELKGKDVIEILIKARNNWSDYENSDWKKMTEEKIRPYVKSFLSFALDYDYLS